MNTDKFLDLVMEKLPKLKTYKETPKKKKYTIDDEASKVEIKYREKVYFENVFKELCALEKEPSSDENTKEKRYLREIEKKVKLKQMKINFDYPRSKKNKSKKKKVKTNKKFDEDETENNDLYKDPEKEEDKLRRERFGKKALRKIFKKLTGTFNKKEIELMIWEVDTNLNGYVSFDEYERMYKRAVIDKKELEPKKLYTLVQFLMYDKEHKGYITEEDTLEVLCVRNKNGLDEAIKDIFNVEVKDEKGKIIRTNKKREAIDYEEFAERMHSLSLRQRTLFMDKKKNFCEKIKEEALFNAKTKTNLSNQI